MKSKREKHLKKIKAEQYYTNSLRVSILNQMKVLMINRERKIKLADEFYRNILQRVLRMILYKWNSWSKFNKKINELSKKIVTKRIFFLWKNQITLKIRNRMKVNSYVKIYQKMWSISKQQTIDFLLKIVWRNFIYSW